MQAITTKYLPPTDHRDGRVVAKASAGSLTLNWDHNADVDENHWRAAEALIAKLGWDKHVNTWMAGHLAETNTEYMVFVGNYEHTTYRLETKGEPSHES